MLDATRQVAVPGHAEGKAAKSTRVTLTRDPDQPATTLGSPVTGISDADLRWAARTSGGRWPTISWPTISGRFKDQAREVDLFGYAASVTGEICTPRLERPGWQKTV